MSSLRDVVYSVKLYLAGVESRHWIQEDYADISRREEWATPVKPENIRGGITIETLPRGEHDISGLHCTDTIRGGGPDLDESISGEPSHHIEVSERPSNISGPVRGGGLSNHEAVSCGCDPVWAEEKYRGGALTTL